MLLAALIEAVAENLPRAGYVSDAGALARNTLSVMAGRFTTQEKRILRSLFLLDRIATATEINAQADPGKAALAGLVEGGLVVTREVSASLGDGTPWSDVLCKLTDEGRASTGKLSWRTTLRR